MAGRAMIALAIAAVVLAGVGAGIALQKHAGSPQVQPETGKAGGGPGGAGKGRMNQGAGQGAEASCSGIGNMTIGQAINWLFAHHYEYKFTYRVYPENRTIVWIIVAPNNTAATILYNHIEQMECVLEHGGSPRPHDPLFRLEANVSKFVKTELYWLNDTAIKVVKKADNDCAFEAIKLHAEVVKGFFTVGREEAQKIHEVPEYLKQLCAPYLNATVSEG